VWKRANNLDYFLENYAIPSLDQAYPSCVAYNALTTIPTPTHVRSREHVSFWVALQHQLPVIGSCIPINRRQLVLKISFTFARSAKSTNSHVGFSASGSLSWLCLTLARPITSVIFALPVMNSRRQPQKCFEMDQDKASRRRITQASKNIACEGAQRNNWSADILENKGSLYNTHCL
jgi:hypothetical protein